MQHHIPPSPPGKIRNSAVELLRAVSMFMIVISHACVHSGFDLTLPGFGLNRFFVQFGVLGNLGVDIFVLISGYFLCSKAVNFRSLLKLLLQVWFYSLTLFLGCRVVFGHYYTAHDYHKVFFPILFQEYWFCTAYVILFLLTPFLNLAIGAMDRKMHRRLIALMLCLWSILPAMTGQYMYNDVTSQFVMLYMIGAYFRKYPTTDAFRPAAGWRRVILAVCLLVLLTLVFDYFEKRIALFENSVSSLYARTSPVIIGCAVSMFSLAVSCKPFYSKFINNLGACAFGIYLIHDNPIVRSILWKRIWRHADYFRSPILPVRILLSAILVYAACALAEYLRIKYIENRLLKMSEQFIGKLRNLRRSERV